MILRPYAPGDAETIVSWIPDEKALRQWSADRYPAFPITAADVNEKYLLRNGDCPAGQFYPLTAVEEESIAGHLILRFTDAERTAARLGFVIVDSARRGQGLGREMLRLAVRYAFDALGAQRLTLGVFENNLPAYRCYKAAGFRDVPEDTPAYYEIGNEKWKCLELAMERGNKG